MHTTDVIERMRWPDIAQVATLDRTCFGADAWSEEFFWSQMAVPGNQFWVARSDDRILGYVGLAVSGPQADILTLASDPEYRGRGLGGRLLDVALDAAGVAGVEAMYLDVRDDNEPAIHLYTTRGFETINRRAGYYAGADALIMRAFVGVE